MDEIKPVMEKSREIHSKQKEQKGQRPHAGSQEVGEAPKVGEASWGPVSFISCGVFSPRAVGGFSAQ